MADLLREDRQTAAFGRQTPARREDCARVRRGREQRDKVMIEISLRFSSSSRAVVQSWRKVFPASALEAVA